MTKRLDHAIEKIRQLPDQRQDDAAEVLFALLEQQHLPAYDLTPEQIAEVTAAIRRADAGDFATDEEVQSVFEKHDL